VKLSCPAGELAAVLGVAALAVADDKTTKRNPILGAVHITAAADAGVRLTTNALDRCIACSCPAATTVQAGEAVVAAERLSGLVAGFPPKSAVVTLALNGTVLMVKCDRSRYRLPIWPASDIPEWPKIGDAVGSIELEHALAVRILSRPLFAASTETTRFYLNGIYLHAARKDELTAVATDGNRLLRIVVPVAGISPTDGGLIVPLASVKPLLRILKKGSDPVSFVWSKSLLEVHSAGVEFASKLIDGTFPDYARIIPEASPNTATLDPTELLAALGRMAAVATGKRPIGIAWDGGDKVELTLLREPGFAASEILPAELKGSCHVAIEIYQLRELVEELAAGHDQISLATARPIDPVLVTVPGDDTMLALQMPIVLGEESAT
jgi:DNA polymerase III subunit beta